MALQIRRGIESDRASVTPETGELLYTTDQYKLYVGDGITAGGTLVTGIGISTVVEDTTPQLGGDLDVNGKKIVSAGNGNIELDPAGSGNIILQGSLTVNTAGNITKTGELNIAPTTLLSIGNNTSLTNGNIYITRNSYSAAVGQGLTFAQHHSSVDAVNFTFYRTRGTGVSPTVVANGDDLADIAFSGWDGTGPAAGAAISATVEGSPVTGHIPTKISFITDNGSTLAIRAELSSAGVWKVNSIQNYSGTELTVTATTVNVSGNINIKSHNDLRLSNASNSNWVALQAPASLSANITWQLPNADGGIGYVLSTNGGGALAWIAPSGVTVSIVDDTSPQLGGNLSVNGHSIVSESDGNITIAPNGTGMIQLTPNIGGKVVLDKINWPTTVGAAGQVLTTVLGGADATWQYIVSSAAPTNAGDAGAPGQIAFDASHVYICVALNTWVRASLATWS